MLKKQFFGKETVNYIVGGLALFVLAGIAWVWPPLAPILLVAICAAMLWITKKDLAWGLGIVLFELIVGGHGLLLHWEGLGSSVSLRHIVFLGFWLGYVWKLVTKEEKLKRFKEDSIIAAMGIWLVATFLVGGLENGWSASFDELNAYFYLAFMVPIAMHRWTSTEKRSVFVGVFAGIVMLAVTTVLFAYAFNHLPGKVMDIVYKIFRDARVFEVTLQVVSESPSGPLQGIMAPFLGERPFWYRIFHPGHIYALLALGLYGGYAIRHGIDKSVEKHWVKIYTLVFGMLLIGMSRSILIGLMGVVVFLIITAIVQKEIKEKWLWQLCKNGVMTLLGASILFVIVAALPIPPKPDLRQAAFYETSRDTDRSVAVASRWSMLGPINEEIKKNPILGAGFGKEVTFSTEDPRTIGLEGAQEISTYRFEWGYQDLILKMGIFGLLMMLYMYWVIADVKKTIRKNAGWMELGALAAIIGLFSTNIFTPYLNHPLGIGLLLFIALLRAGAGIGVKASASEIKQKAMPTTLLGSPAISAAQKNEVHS